MLETLSINKIESNCWNTKHVSNLVSLDRDLSGNSLFSIATDRIIDLSGQERFPNVLGTFFENRELFYLFVLKNIEKKMTL